ncbi:MULTISPECIES: MrcB family domain-containing protein [unclassified Streptomyces]|uniref:MrcB family domain-containing protein n=1 Tax=unclassified Streptomyces TaxID=2593676 RepID=UPI00381918EC
MGIRDLLSDVATTYDRTKGSQRDVIGQQVLRAVGRRTDLLLPPGFRAEGHGGQTTPAATPWIGLFDSAGNADPKQGLYLAYIFSADLKNVTLTLQQGITSLEKRLGKGKAREEHLRRHASRLRRAVAAQRRQGWTDEPSLRDEGTRPRAYEAASVIARSYPTDGLPKEVDLQEDLMHGVDLLRRAELADQAWWLADNGQALEVGYDPAGHGDGVDPLAGFRPKDSSDYIANIKAKQQVKRRSHEKLIKDFGLHVATRGYAATTDGQHPKDLVLRSPSMESGTTDEWLVEAKVVRNGNPTEAVRQAVGQLYEYSYFLYQKKRAPHLVGLFSEDIGAYSTYLEHQGIASVWQTDSGWGGSSLASRWGMTA